jgi:peptidoglycan biosynthesis protein MviN/MurJ (putative lipid II flippase)
MTPPSPAPLRDTPRGRAVAFLAATAAVVLVFAVFAVLDIQIGGQNRAQAAIAGTVIFAVVFLLGLTRRRRSQDGREPEDATRGATKALTAVAIILWVLALVCWWLAATGISLRFGADPVLFAVPLTVYPGLILWAWNPRHATLAEVHEE